jgi:hypothetical protein
MFLFLLMCEEWGDKSQIAAIALAANYGVESIIIGGALVRHSHRNSSIGSHSLYLLCLTTRLLRRKDLQRDMA